MMEERSVGAFPEGNPVGADRPAVGGASPGTPPHLADPRTLQILATEHWSLLAGRSLSYNEAFTRAGMFLSFLAASLVALALIAQVTGVTTELVWIAALILAVDLFIGLATLGRCMNAGAEELHAVRGMNRIRHAYLELVPTLEPYFVTPWHDDPESVLAIYDTGTEDQGGLVAGIVHGLTTTPGMIGVIVAVIGGVLAAVVAIGVGATTTLALLAGLVAGGLTFAAGIYLGWRAAIKSMYGAPVLFPSPTRPTRNWPDRPTDRP